MIRAVEIGILFSSSISSRGAGLRFLESLPPVFYPKKFNNFEPINKEFNEKTAKAALDLWMEDLLWRPKTPRTCGSFFSGKMRRRHDVVKFDTTAKALGSLDLIDLFGSIDRNFGIDFAYIYIGTDEERDLGREYYFQHMEPYKVLLTDDLQQGLPNLTWVTVFGEPYRELFGNRLESAPAHRVVPLETSVLVQLTEKPESVSKSFSEFQARRKAVQEHLDCNAFRATGTKPFNVPPFDFVVN